MPLSGTRSSKNNERPLTNDLKEYTTTEVSQHNKADDCWIIIGDRVYDVTKFIAHHPGGDIILTHAGFDATEVFYSFHPAATTKYLPTYLIGRIVDSNISEVGHQTRALWSELHSANLFQSSKVFYTNKMLSNLILVSVSVLFLAYLNNTIGVIISALLMALFWQQCGWLSHDFLHNQVFQDRKWNIIAGLFVGSFCQGFSVNWWKDKHNRHHAGPNVVHIDHDIDTMPFLAWSEKMIEADLDGLPDILVKNQKIFYWILLGFARISWLLQSILWQFSHKKDRVAESTCLAVHYIFYFGLIYHYLSLPQAVLFFVVSQCMAGMLYGIVFTLGHNGMTVMEKSDYYQSEYVMSQLQTTRDVVGSGLVSWFMGGLDYQVEHHLFPRVPRHHLHLIRSKYLEPFCEKHNLPFHLTPFFKGLNETVKCLENVTSSYLNKNVDKKTQ